MSFFDDKKPSATTDYYMPISIKAIDVKNSHTWILAQSPQFHRLFYKSPEELYSAQKERYPERAISCYKVLLTDEQCEIVNKGQEIEKGRLAALSFLPKEIASCIEFTSATLRIEHTNPSYTAIAEHQATLSM
ncbi:MAG: hypothetical protein Q8M03_07945 [Legionella sp.]|nr:hypothetical protein [Legionella sp.]